MSQPARRQAEESRDSLGRFRPGNAIGKGYGRPKGSYDLLAIARRRAREEGLDLRAELWRVVLVLLRAAQEGDTTAAKLVLDRLAGPVEKGTELSVSVSQITGPVPPPVGDLPAYARELARLAEKFSAPQVAKPEPACDPWAEQLAEAPAAPVEAERPAAEPIPERWLAGGPPSSRWELAPRPSRWFVD